MADFDTSHVKNVVLLGHAGAGKTTLTECMLFEAGLIPRRGSVEEKKYSQRLPRHRKGTGQFCVL